MFMDEAIKEAKLAENSKNIPIGAVVVFNNKIIGRGHNDRLNNPNVINHAEIIAINEAETNLNDWRLNECDLYVTLEPCDMCKEVIKESRIKNVYYLLDKEYKNKFNTNFQKLNDTQKEMEYKEKLVNFFKDNCNR